MLSHLKNIKSFCTRNRRRELDIRGLSRRISNTPTYRAAIFYVMPKSFARTYRGGHTNRLDAVLWVRALNELGYLVDFYDRNCCDADIRSVQYDVLLANVSGGSGVRLPRRLLEQSAAVIGLMTSTNPIRRNAQVNARLRASKLDYARQTATRSASPEVMAQWESVHAAAIVGFQGSECWNSYEGEFPIKCNYIPCTPDGLHSSYQCNHRDPKRIVCLSGSGFILKGINILLDALHNLSDYKVDLFIDMSAKNDADALKMYVDRFGLPKNVTFHDPVNIVSEKFISICRRAAFGLSLSCSEGCSTSMLAMMRLGLIPIHTLAVGIPVIDERLIVTENAKIVHNAVSVISKCSEMDLETLNLLRLKSEQIGKLSEEDHSLRSMVSCLRRLISQLP